MNKLYAVGIGPGDYEKMTLEAVKVLSSCDVIVGYTVYVDLVREHFPEKEFLTTPMRREEERCRMAFEEAAKGKTTAMICSGDAGVYGMAAGDGKRLPGLSGGGDPGSHRGPVRGGGAGSSPDSRFCGDQPERSSHPLGAD